MSDVGLRPPANRVSPRTPWVWAARAVLPVVGVGVALGLADGPLHWFAMTWWLWVLYVVAALAYLVGMPLVRYRIHRWETTDAAVYTQTGWLTTERRIAPMSRVQTVDFDQGPIARLVGLASVTVTTASAAGPLRIDGLDLAVAQRMVAELTRRTDAEPGDAT